MIPRHKKALGRALQACIAALLVALPCQLALAAVFGDDDRRKLGKDDALYPLNQALGEITCRHPDSGKKLTGTAAFIDTGAAQDGQEILITAAHVVMDPTTGKPLDQCRFKHHGRRWGSDPVVGVRHGAFDGTPQTNPEDWALVMVSTGKPAPLRLPLWSGTTEAVDATALIGYRGDQGGLWISEHCFARAPEPGEALHGERVWLSNCDASPGSSGAPLLLRRGERWYWGGLYRGHLYDPTRHPATPTHQPEFSGREAMNIIVQFPAH